MAQVWASLRSGLLVAARCFPARGGGEVGWSLSKELQVSVGGLGSARQGSFRFNILVLMWVVLWGVSVKAQNAANRHIGATLRLHMTVAPVCRACV